MKKLLLITYIMQQFGELVITGEKNMIRLLDRYNVENHTQPGYYLIKIIFFEDRPMLYCLRAKSMDHNGLYITGSDSFNLSERDIKKLKVQLEALPAEHLECRGSEPWLIESYYNGRYHQCIASE